jgi:hypothetical protein
VNAAAARVERVVRGVVAAAVRGARAGGVVVLEDWTPEGELTYEWLVRELSEARVWRVASLASNVHAEPAESHVVAAWQAMRERGALLAHPANRTALLLGGMLPRADVFPLGDAYASQVEAMAGRWHAPPEISALARRLGGVAALDRALVQLVDGGGRESLGIEAGLADEIVRLYERGRYHRLRPRLVPKLGTRTLDIDLFE